MSADARTVSFLSLLRGTAHRCGLDPDNLATTEAAAFAEHLSVAAKKAWQHYDWPDCVRIEERSLKPEYDEAETYAAGDIVYGGETTGGYYTSAQADNTGQALTDTDWWTPTDPFALAFDLLAEGETPIGEVLNIYDADPDLDGTSATGEKALPIGFRLSQTQVIMEPGAPNTVWLRFRLPAPRFTTTVWSSGATYAAGDLIYYTDGHCYLVLATTSAGEDPADTPEKFRAQTLPLLFENAVKRLAKAEWLGSEEQEEKSIALQKLAEGDLDDATKTLSDDQGQTRRYAVATRTTTRRQFQPRRIAR